MNAPRVVTVPGLLVAQVVLPYDESAVRAVSTEVNDRPELTVLAVCSAALLFCLTVIFLRRRHRPKYRNR